MPRYFFDIMVDQQTLIHDHHGVELSGVERARQAAAEELLDFLRTAEGSMISMDQCSVKVAGSAGPALFRVPISDVL